MRSPGGRGPRTPTPLAFTPTIDAETRRHQRTAHARVRSRLCLPYFRVPKVDGSTADALVRGLVGALAG
jgi:hypothetical protein